MKPKFITTLFILTLAFVFFGFAQTPGFKVNSELSTITIGTPTGRLSDAKTHDNKLLQKLETKEYITREIILYNYNAGLIKTKSTSLKNVKNELNDDSKLDTPKLTDIERKAKLAEIDNYGKEILELEAENKSLYGIYVKDYINYRRCMVLNFGPSRSEAFFEIMYDKNDSKIINVLNNSGFNFGSNTAALYSELASGHLRLFRVSLGAMVVASSEDDPEVAKEETAYQRLATYGGNTVLNIEYPLMYLHSRRKDFNLLSRALVRGAADFPQFGSTTDEVTGNISYGIDLYCDAATGNGQLRFFANFNFYRVKGTNTFKDNLGVTSSAFNYGQLIVGLVVAEKIKLSFVVNTVSSEDALRDATLIGGGQVLR